MTDDKPLTGADFPPLREGLIDGAGLAALFADLTCCTEVLEALEKGAPTARAASPAAPPGGTPSASSASHISVDAVASA